MTGSMITWGPRVSTPFGWYMDSERPNSGLSITHDSKSGRFILGQTEERSGRRNHCVVAGFDSLPDAIAAAELVASD